MEWVLKKIIYLKKKSIQVGINNSIMKKMERNTMGQQLLTLERKMEKTHHKDMSLEFHLKKSSTKL
jgi:hypothetical protein